MRRKKIVTFLIKLLKSKLAVVVVLLSILGIGLVNNAYASSSNYNFSTCYQYYMLDNRADSTRSQAGNTKVANIAPLGSGGISGTFSYNDIVNSAPNEGSKAVAKKFVSMMATYSTFGYFSNKVQGFESWGSYAGRFIMMILLLPLAILMDFVNMLVPAMLKIFAKFNVIPFLGAVLTNMSFKSGLLDALGLSKEQVSAFFNGFLAIAISFIVISLVMALRRGSQNIDKHHLRKFETRILTLICLPLIVGAMATLLNNVGELAKKAPSLNATFSRYLVDDRSWAYNFNFAPLGDTNQKSDISGNSGSFVDLGFDPYETTGRNRIYEINKNSSLAGTGAAFPNSALLIAYGMSQSFSATDYINFEGSEQSFHLLGQNYNASQPTYGTYNGYANSFSTSELLDTDHAYTPSGHSITNKKDQQGSYVSAIDDYNAGHHQLNTSKENAWRDRFIYGVKNSGDLDKYYGQEPSQEMVKNQVGGTGKLTVPSDQSMFLILSTIFEENGGRYYINAPARGIKQVQGQFDSNRSEYYVVSMIGNPFFTIIGMLTQPLLTLVVLLAVLIAIMSVGLLDMNIKPFSAIFKAFAVGDIEYLEAFSFYTLGIAGTAIMFEIMPSFLILMMQGVSSFLVKAIPVAAGLHPNTAQQSLAYNGMPLIIQGFVAALFAVLWLKSSQFRERLNEFFCMPWDWAQGAARRVENQAFGGRNRETKYFASKANNRARGRFAKAQEVNDMLKDLALRKLGKDPLTSTVGKNGNLPLGKGIVESDNVPKTDDPDETNDSENMIQGVPRRFGDEPKSPEDIKRNGQFDRINENLSGVQNDPHISRPIVDKVLAAQSSVNKFKQKPDQKHYVAARTKLMDLNHELKAEGAPTQQIASTNKAIKELNDIGKGYKLNSKKSQLDKPVLSKNSGVTDNDDAKVEKTLANQRQDTNVIKPQNTKPVVSTKETRSQTSVLPDKGNNHNVVVKPKSEKPVVSANGTKRNGGKVFNQKTIETKTTERRPHGHTSRIVKTTTGGTNKPVRSANKAKTVVSKSMSKPTNVSNKYIKDSHNIHKSKTTNTPTKTVKSRISKHHESRIANTHNKSNIERHNRTITKSSTTHNNPVNKFNDRNEIKRIINQRNVHKASLGNSRNFVTDNQLKGVISSLGSAVKDQRVAKPLNHLYSSKNLSEVKRNIRGLQKAVRALDSNTKKQIDKEHLVDNLFNLQNSNKFGGKE